MTVCITDCRTIKLIMWKKAWNSRKRTGFQKQILVGLGNERVGGSSGIKSEGNKSIGELTVIEKGILKTQQQTTLTQRKHWKRAANSLIN